MYKRGKKITSLLVALAAVISMVPESADAKVKSIGIKEGAIGNAIAYKDGKYIYQRPVEEDFDEITTTPAAIYYNSGKGEKEIDKLKYPVLKSMYSNKYVEVEDIDNVTYDDDGNIDDYDIADRAIDLENGNVIENYDFDDKLDLLESDLTDKFNSTARFGNISYVSLNKFSEDRFEAPWYSYSVGISGNAAGFSDAISNGSNYYLSGFTNEAGEYIDTCRLANIYAFSSKLNQEVQIKNFNVEEQDTKLTAKLDWIEPMIIAQDSQHIYAIVKVRITDSNNNENSCYKLYLQKISKAPDTDNKANGAYIPENVTSYEISQGSDACGTICGSNDSDVPLGDCNKYVVKNNELYVINTNSDKVTVTKLDLIDDTTHGNKVEKSDEEQQVISGLEEKAVSIDIDGNVWCIDDGKIYEFSGTDNGVDKKEIYDADSDELNALDVYDKDNLIVWEVDGDKYATYSENSNEDNSDSEVTVKIKGKAEVGETLTAEVNNFYESHVTTGSAVTYKWFRVSGKDSLDGEAIDTAKTYKLKNNDEDKYIRLRAYYNGEEIGQDITGMIESTTSGTDSSDNKQLDSDKTHIDEDLKKIMSGDSEGDIIADALNNPNINNVIANLVLPVDDRSIPERLVLDYEFNKSKGSLKVDFNIKDRPNSTYKGQEYGKAILRSLVYSTENKTIYDSVYFGESNTNDEAIYMANVTDPKAAILLDNGEPLLDARIIDSTTINSNKKLVIQVEPKVVEIDGNNYARLNQRTNVVAPSDNIPKFFVNVINGTSTSSSFNGISAVTGISGTDTVSGSTANNDNAANEPETIKLLVAEVKGTSDGHIRFTQNNIPLTGFVTIVGGEYYLDSNGIMQTGWIQRSPLSPWYYFDLQTGDKKKGWFQVDNKCYFSDRVSGEMKTGWLNDNSLWYYLNEKGEMQRGWFKDTNGSWYFFYDNGVMAAGTNINGYEIAPNGVCVG